MEKFISCHLAEEDYLNKVELKVIY